MTTTHCYTDSWFKRTSRAIHIPPVYFFLIVIFLVSGLLDQIFSDGQIFTNPAIMLNIIVRSVALGIVAVGQTLVILGASIDLSVAYTISITAVMSSYIMQGETANVPIAILVVFGIGLVIGLVKRTDHHQTEGQSLYCHPGNEPDHQRHHQRHILQLHRQCTQEL